MSPLVVSLEHRVFIECSALSEEQRTSLEAYLQAQPEVWSVDHEIRRRNPYTPDRDTLGFLFHLAASSQLTLQFAETVAAGLTVRVAQRLIETWWKQWRRKKSPKSKGRKVRSRKTEHHEVIQITGDGNRITVVKNIKE